MLGVCCSDNVNCRTGPECCEEKLQDAFSSLSFDEIKQLIHTNNNSCFGENRNFGCLEENMTKEYAEASLKGHTAAEGSVVVTEAGAGVLAVNRGAVEAERGQVSSWRLKSLEVANYLREEGTFETDAGKHPDLSYTGDEGIGQLNLQLLESAAAATACTVRGSGSRSATPRKGDPSSARSAGSRSARKAHQDIALMDGLHDDMFKAGLGKAVHTQLSARSEKSASGWSVISEEPPGACSQSGTTPAMGALLIEQGFAFDQEGFHEVGSLDDPRDNVVANAVANQSMEGLPPNLAWTPRRYQVPV